MTRWPIGREYLIIMEHFKQLCGLPSVLGKIDGNHIQVEKPWCPHVVDYFNKRKVHFVQLQGIVNYKRRFIDIFVGLSGSYSDNRVLRRFNVYYKTQREGNFLFLWIMPHDMDFLPTSSKPSLLLRNSSIIS